MKIRGVKRFCYFHHYFPKNDGRGLHLYNLAMGWGLFTAGIHWCPHYRDGTSSGYHVWLCLPFVSLMLEWNRGAAKEGGKP
jgi:hypothetical protein